MDTNTNTESQTTEAAKVKTVIDDMDSRRIFPNVDAATAYIQKCAAEFTDFAGYPVAAAGLTEDNEFDPEIYTESMDVVVSVLTKRGEGKGATTVQCIVIYPSPRLDDILANATGKTWLEGILAKELNHVAVRNLRKAENSTEIAEAVELMPTTLADFVTSGRESGGGIAESYNQLWQVIKKGIGGKSKPFALANLSKKELRKAMESASYAATVYPQLEERQNKAGEKESLFELAATFGKLLANQTSLDDTLFVRALATRNEKTIDVADDEEDFDLDAMAAAISKASESTEAETTTDTATDAPAETGDEAVTDSTDEATGEEAEGDAATE